MSRRSLLSAAVLALWFTGLATAETPLALTLQTRTATDKPVTFAEQWLPSRTAM